MADVFQTYKNVDIMLTDDGRFSASFAGRTITRASLASVKREIDKKAQPIEVMVVNTDEAQHPYKVTAVRITKRDVLHSDRGGTTKLGWRRHAFVYDEALFDELAGLYAEHRALQDRWQAKCNELELITQEHFTVEASDG